MLSSRRVTPKDQAEVARRLATWFEGAQRDLAWRRTRDPYAIWVSEVMLQQTRVETVEVYWPAFLRRFPTVQALADADEQAVLEAWSGLGYYRRARFLHKGARYVVDQLGGELPADEAGLRAIPGVGPYTAGAIGSIAFDQPIALVDGNVARVLSRLDAITDPKQQDAAAKHHWKRVGELLTHAPPRVLAQALMELGATVCTPKNPRCEDCPVRKHCVAKRRGLEREIPAPKQKKRSPESHFVALALTWGEQLLLERRASEGLLASMWCPVLFEQPGPAFDGVEDRVRAQAVARLHVDVTLEGGPEAPVKHVFTHRVWHVHPWRARARRRPKTRGRTDGLELAWIEPGERPEGGIPTLTEKVLERLGY